MGTQIEHRKLALRTLYTVNNSQYILARSPVRVPVFPIPNHQEFASVSLRKCLDAISVSSPELCQDSSRDFSIYVLDPLESRAAPVPTPSLSGSPTSGTTQKMTSGVAVGLGLMSWAFLADEQDSVMVTGTLTKTSTGEDALEVIFSLIETHHITRAALPATMRAWGAPQPMPPPPPPSETVLRSETQPKRGRSSSSRPSKSPDTDDTNAKSRKPSSSTHVGRQAISSPSRKRTLSQMMEELPGTYIGPPAKKAGRPPITGGLASRLRLSGNMVATSTSAPPAKPSSTTTDLSSLLALLPPEHNQAIIAALATIDADNNSNASSSTVDKGKCRENPQLLNAIAHLVQVSRGVTGPASPPARIHVKAQPDDDEIVLLDKENVNPGAFKRSSSFFKSDDVADEPTSEPASAPTSAPSLPPPSVSTSTPLTPRRFKRSHSLVDAEASASLSAPAFAFSTSANVTSKKSLSPKKATPTKNQSMTLSSIHTRFVQSSPITPSNINFHPIPGSSCPKPRRAQENVISTATTTASAATSSSSGAKFTFRTISTPASANAGASASTTDLVSATKRIVYKKPEWAKTDTETKPRMAEWVVAKAREEEEASKLKRTQRKEEAKKEKQLREKEARRRRRESTNSSAVGNLAPPLPPPSGVARSPSTPPRRRVSTDFLPVLPSDDNSFAYFRSPIAKISERRPPSTSRTRAAPVTPPPRTPRKRSSGMSSGGTRIGSSLFTPKTPTPRITNTAAKARFPSGSNNNSRKQDRRHKSANDDLDNIFASPSPTKRHHSTTSILSHEPETPSKRGRVSPQTRILSNKSPGVSSRAASAGAAAAFSSDELDADDAETEEEPSSSLPFLTSDAAFNELEGMTHWSVGLPPSSPPPVSSPSLTPSLLESEAELEIMLDPELDAGTEVDTDTDDATVATPATTTSGTGDDTTENTPASDIDCGGSKNVLDSSPTSVSSGEDTSETEDGPKLLSCSSSQQERRGEVEEAALDLAAFSDLFAKSSTSSSPPLVLDNTKGFSGSTQAPGTSDASALTLASCDFDFSFTLPSTSTSVDPANMFPDLDFTQFWASVGPLDEVTTSIGSGGDDGDSTNEHDDSLVGSTPTTTEVDATKIAEQMQKLFSGCLM